MADTLASRVIVTHSVLLASAPFVQAATGIRGGWNEATMLVMLFVIGPVLGLFLRRSGQERIGTVLLLAFLSAATYMHVDMMLSFLDGQEPDGPVTAAVIGLQMIFVLLLLSSLFGSLLSLALLRTLHRTQAETERTQTS